MTGNDVQSPTEAPLVSPSSEMASDGNKCDNGKVQMKKQLGLIEGTAIILGIIFGSGNWMKWSMKKNKQLTSEFPI